MAGSSCPRSCRGLADAPGLLPGQRAQERGLVETADLLDAAAVAITP
ncbi:hypothetical protein [Solidesulfovibrio carbinolicus]|nr:hypothetical protein [Solidesulfovibrio carbinolicus]